MHTSSASVQQSSYAYPPPLPGQGVLLYGQPRPDIPLHTPWVVLACTFFIIPLGLKPLYYARQVNRLLVVGDIEGARAASQKIPSWLLAATASGIVAWIIIFAIIFFAVL